MPLALGTLLVPLAFAVAGLMMGNLWDWYDQGIRFVVDVYQVDGSRWRLFALAWTVISQSIAWLLVAGLLGGGIWVAHAGAAPRHLLLLAGMLVTVAISYAVQNKGFGYHLGGLIPVLTVLALGGAELALRTRLTGPARLAASAAAICIVVAMAAGVARRTQHYILPFLAQLRIHDPATFQQQVAATNEAVAIIDRESRPDDRFFQWGWHSDVGFLAQRLSASRFVFPLFAQIDAKTRYMGWIAIFREEMARNRPAFILLDLTTVPPGTDTAQFPLCCRPTRPRPGCARWSNCSTATMSCGRAGRTGSCSSARPDRARRALFALAGLLAGFRLVVAVDLARRAEGGRTGPAARRRLAGAIGGAGIGGLGELPAAHIRRRAGLRHRNPGQRQHDSGAQCELHDTLRFRLDLLRSGCGILSRYPRRYPDCGSVRRHVRQHHRIGADPRAVADHDAAEHLGAGPDIDLGADHRRVLSPANGRS